MDKKDYITFEELFEIIENAPDSNYKTAADFLMTAVTDWPTLDLKEPVEMIIELKSVIMNDLNFDNLEKYYNSLRPETDGWKMEAVSSLLEMFDFDRNSNFDRSIELNSILEKLTTYYRKVK